MVCQYLFTLPEFCGLSLCCDRFEQTHTFEEGILLLFPPGGQPTLNGKLTLPVAEIFAESGWLLMVIVLNGTC